jgi:hypothetical protein
MQTTKAPSAPSEHQADHALVFFVQLCVRGGLVVKLLSMPSNIAIY